MLAAALSAALLALGFMGPALLPPAWSGAVSLGLAGVLSLLLGGMIRRAGGHWGTTLLWLGWVLAAVQWGWAWGSQPSGLAYWLAGLLLGVVGAALVRPESRLLRPTVTEEATETVTEEAPDAEPLTLADTWTAPLDAPDVPQTPLTPAPAGREAAQWSVPIAPAPSPQTGQPAWAVPVPPERSVGEGEGWSVPMAGTSAPPRRPGESTSHWQNQTWWAPDDEPGGPPSLERALAERRPERGPKPKEDIEDRE
ncbi:hypothetical protein GCM10017783_15110 [Deinococcus piscis]|uniref:Uncharacterized protein n=1 Tax=Deinococcus piscis TaxID=394230 RepID=A0ABQ3K4L5_9DEIO|nr:hypothetical protein [Deinococcus piscis]GHG03596.1 hypothetical protein GCM10017783_15110 [Deinococcus piscis]